MATIPSHFRKLRIGGEFVENTGGLFGTWTGEKVQVGFLVEPRHCNPHGICHGGMLTTLADMLVPCAAAYQEQLKGRFLPTVSLQVDFLGSAKAGAWVQAEAQVLRHTRNLLFAQGIISADGEPVARLSGIYKFGPEAPYGSDTDPFGLLGAA